jgi:hypothetical protein
MASGWLGLDWGNVPAWVGSVLTGSSILIASLTYRRSVEDKRREQQDRERLQAANVSAWIDLPNGRVYLQNSNDVTIKARIFLEPHIEGQSSVVFQEVPIGPKQKVHNELPGWATYLREDSETPSVLIVDSAGAIWIRDSRGKLDRILEQDRTNMEEGLLKASNITTPWRTS